MWGGVQVHRPEASAGSPAAGTVVVAAPARARAQEIQVSQRSLCSKLVCVIVHVREEEETGGEGICDTKLHFSVFFTYKGSPYLLKSIETRC